MRQGNYALFLDDERDLSYIDTSHTGTWWVARSSAEAKSLILTLGLPTYIAFDHDLGGEDKAMTLLYWLDAEGYVEAFPPPKWGLHSGNPVGRENIAAFMNSWAKFWKTYKRS
jgi:hypothetical protein